MKFGNLSKEIICIREIFSGTGCMISVLWIVMSPGQVCQKEAMLAGLGAGGFPMVYVA